MTIDIKKLTREAGLCLANDEHPLMEAFATLHRAAVVAELIEGVGDPVHHIMADGKCIGYYSAEQVAGAVAKEKEATDYAQSQLQLCDERIAELEAQNAKLREDYFNAINAKLNRNFD